MWFLSVMVVLANLLLVYASLPEQVVIHENTERKVPVGKELLFYTLMTAILLINVMVYLLRRMLPEAENFRAWFHGLLITINLFFIISMQAVNVYNGTDNFDHNRVIIFVSGSLGLILLWAAIWPLYLLYQKFFIKQAI